MKEYLLRRMLALAPVMFVVATLVFVLMHLTPGDPVSAMLGMDASPTDVARMRSRLDLDQPLYVQYALWMGKVVRGTSGSRSSCRSLSWRRCWSGSSQPSC